MLKQILADPEQRLLSSMLEDENPVPAPAVAGGRAIRHFRERSASGRRLRVRMQSSGSECGAVAAVCYSAL